MGGICTGLKQTIMRCDLLACAPTLRVKGQPAYQSVLGGFLSFVIMSLFIAIFFTSFLEVLNRVDISATMSSSDKTESTNEVGDLMFAIGIEDIQLGGAARYFDIYMEQVSISGNTGASPMTVPSQIMLEPCNIDNWKNVGDHFEEQFNVFQMGRMLCVRDGTPVSLKGYEGSPDYSYLTLKIKTCTNNSYESVPCKTHTQISTFISTYLTTHDFFKVKFLIVDTRISPSQQNPISKILQKKIFMSFTDQLGTKGYISFAHYTVTTDTSIMPYSDEDVLEGSYIHKYATSTIGLSSDRFVYLEFFKATEELAVNRAVVKVDQMLSYVGGLFGLLWVVVAFFLASFNEYRYQLYASESAFTFDQSGRKIKEKDFGFITYVGYSIYDWMNTFGCAPKCWTKMREIDEAREEICEQLDVTYLFRKIRSLEKTTACLMDHNKRICSMLTREPTLQQVKQQRKLLQLYSKLNPSPCQSHSITTHPINNKVQNSSPSSSPQQQSGQDFMMNDKVLTMNLQLQNNNSQVQTLSCASDIDFEGDQEYETIMEVIKDAYASIEGQDDDVCRRIREKIPMSVKRAIQKKRWSRNVVVVQEIGGGNGGIGGESKFTSCENSFRVGFKG